MSSDQIFLYVIMALGVLLWVVRAIRRRGIPRRTASEVHELLSGKHGTVLLDVRTEAERRGSAIKGSHHIPLHRIRSRSNELEKFRNREIVCYCQTGNRSLTAAAALRRLGFTASSLEGGIVEWNSVVVR